MSYLFETIIINIVIIYINSMDLQHIFANAIVLGVLAFALSYGYMYWEEKNKAKKRKSKKLKRVSILIPGIVGAVVWLTSSFYFDKNPPIIEEPHLMEEPPLLEDTIPQTGGLNIKKNKFAKSKVGRIELPEDDVFLDII